MKKILSLLLVSICLFSLVSCANDATRGYIEPDNIDYGDRDNIDALYFEGEVVEIFEKSIQVKVLEEYKNITSFDLASVSTKDIVIDFSMLVGDIVGITYMGDVAETYPVQIKDTMGIDLIRSVGSLFDYIEENGKIKYNDTWYDKDKLSSQTLEWLNMSPTDKMLSSYYPFEFVEGMNWGIEVSVDNVTPNGLTVICKHSTEKELTDVYDLQTGSFYSLEVLENSEYIPLEHSIENLAWTSEAWIIEKDSESKWSLDWEWLYGPLLKGQYRVGKEIMNFKETGVYETIMVYGYVEIV